MTTLNKVKTNAPLTDVAKTKQETNLLIRHKYVILITQTVINIALLIYAFFFAIKITDETSTLVVKDTMFPIQFVKNIEFAIEVFMDKKDYAQIFPKFYVGRLLYVYHVNKLSNELQNYQTKEQCNLTFDAADNERKTQELLEDIRYYANTEDKKEALETEGHALMQETIQHETELIAVYSPQGYVPNGIWIKNRIKDLDDDPILHGTFRCRLLALSPNEADKLAYQQVEKYFNVLFQDPYVSFALNYMQKYLDEYPTNEE